MNAGSSTATANKKTDMFQNTGRPSNEFLLTGVLFCAGTVFCFIDPYVSAGLFASAALPAVRTALKTSRKLNSALSEKAALDERLLQAQKMASLGELSAGIAHEINNPLAILGQEAELLKLALESRSPSGPDGDMELEERVCEILKQVNRCADITHKMLDFARKHKAKIQNANLNDLLEGMARLVERDACCEGISIIRRYIDPLPRVLTDPPLVKQVALNLLSNAAQATENGGTIFIRTGVTDNRESIFFEIQDTGCGIPSENTEKIFQPFFTTKPTGKGTGLGLSICLRIVNELGGVISVNSQPGKGSTFAVRLPVKTSRRRGVDKH